MEPTKLLYLEEFLSLSCEAKVVETSQEEGRDIIILDRVVMFNDFAVPCGGTHVANLIELEHETIRKIKNEGTNVRVAYDVQR